MSSINTPFNLPTIIAAIQWLTRVVDVGFPIRCDVVHPGHGRGAAPEGEGKRGPHVRVDEAGVPVFHGQRRQLQGHSHPGDRGRSQWECCVFNM